jgi:hypothetical protein
MCYVHKTEQMNGSLRVYLATNLCVPRALILTYVVNLCVKNDIKFRQNYRWFDG